ncbi:MAG TPA: alkaline phosphatase family protein [Candidatus Dormibacteraeota bacterium]|nr:alkaline phosphatase family protein [Candidatus Dormibacteraeota bacterium]
MTRVVLLGLDGFPHRAIGPELTPRLSDLAQRGGRAPDGGVTDLPSSTDPGFCSLLTGCKPATHGVLTTSWRFARLPDWAGAQTPRVPAIFDACRAAGVRTAAIVADDRGLLCTDSADRRWPPDGVIPPGTPLDGHGYPVNAAVLPHLLDAIGDPSLGFVFGHINEADTAGHDYGPESDAARACYRATDESVGVVLDALASRWADTVVVIVSDHDMQARDSSQPVDPMTNGTDGGWDAYIPDGGSALIHLKPGVDPEHAGAALLRIDGIETWVRSNDSLLIAGSKPGRIFAAPRYPTGGFHGAPITARTVALVGGGNPVVRRIAGAIASRRPHLADWAPTIAPLLGVALGRVDGRDMLR